MEFSRFALEHYTTYHLMFLRSEIDFVQGLSALHTRDMYSSVRGCCDESLTVFCPHAVQDGTFLRSDFPENIVSLSVEQNDLASRRHSCSHAAIWRVSHGVDKIFQLLSSLELKGWTLVHIYLEILTTRDDTKRTSLTNVHRVHRLGVISHLSQLTRGIPRERDNLVTSTGTTSYDFFGISTPLQIVHCDCTLLDLAHVIVSLQRPHANLSRVVARACPNIVRCCSDNIHISHMSSNKTGFICTGHISHHNLRSATVPDNRVFRFRKTKRRLKILRVIKRTRCSATYPQDLFCTNTSLLGKVRVHP